MSNGNGSPHFIVSTPTHLLDRLRRWADEMTPVGLRPDYINAIRTMNRRLETAPGQWGDPIFQYKHIDAVECRGLIARWFLVWYGLSDPTRVVVVRDILPAPGSPLSRPV